MTKGKVIHRGRSIQYYTDMVDEEPLRNRVRQGCVREGYYESLLQPVN